VAFSPPGFSSKYWKHGVVQRACGFRSAVATEVFCASAFHLLTIYLKTLTFSFIKIFSKSPKILQTSGTGELSPIDSCRGHLSPLSKILTKKFAQNLWSSGRYYSKLTYSLRSAAMNFVEIQCDFGRIKKTKSHVVSRHQEQNAANS
jgi:hypothetical protein